MLGISFVRSFAQQGAVEEIISFVEEQEQGIMEGGIDEGWSDTRLSPEEGVESRQDPSSQPGQGGQELKDWVWVTRGEIINILGQPADELGDGEMSMAYPEKDIVFIYNPDVAGEQIISLILMSGSDYRYQGTGPGMTFSQIKSQLGEPFFEGLDEMHGEHMLIYDFDGIELYYQAESQESPVSEVIIINKNLI